MKKSTLYAARALIFALCLFAAASFGVGAFAAADITSDEIVSAVFAEDATSYEVKLQFTDDFVSAHKGETVSLFAVAPYGSASKLAEYTPVGTAKVENKLSFKVKCDLAKEPQLVYSKFIAAIETGASFAVCAPARYFDNPTVAAKYKYDFPEVISAGNQMKKGLRTTLWSDAIELGISHTVIDVAINDFIVTEPGDTYSYEFAGETRYVSRKALDALDMKTRLMTDAGVNVYFDFVLTAKKEGQSSALDCLYYPDIPSSAVMCALNVGDERAVTMTQGLLSFLCDRYTDPEGTHGFCGSYIWGFNVNSNRNYHYMGPMNMDSFLNYYIVAFRMADTAVRTVYSNARVYLPLDNNFNVLSSDMNRDPDSQVDYDSKTFLIKFADKVKWSGDIPWRLALCASPSDRQSSSIWLDDYATTDANSPFVTMKNIDVMTLFLSTEQFLYNGSPRSVLIHDFSVAGAETAGYDGVMTSAAETGDTTANQTASYAYAYYQALFSDTIEAIIYSDHVDGAGSRRGLWTSADTNGDGYVEPVERKAIYNVFKYIDTSRSAEMTSSSLNIIGIGGWSDLVKRYDQAKTGVSDIYETIPQLTSDLTRQLDDKMLFDFSRGSYCGFFWSYLASGPDTTIQLEQDPEHGNKTVLHANMSSRWPGEYMGIGATALEDTKNVNKETLALHPIPLDGARYISFDIKVDAPENVKDISVMLWTSTKGSAAEKAAKYEGVAQITAGAWTNVAFKVDSLTDVHPGADSFKILIRPSDGEVHEGSYSMYLRPVLVWTKPASRFLAFLKGIGIFLLVVVILAVIGLAALIIRRTLILARHKEERARRRAEIQAQRTGIMQANAGKKPRRRPGTPDQTGLTAAVKPNPYNDASAQTGQQAAAATAPRPAAQRRPTRIPQSDGSLGTGSYANQGNFGNESAQTGEGNAANTGTRPAARMINTSTRETPAVREDPNKTKEFQFHIK